tara:strand:+ start:287 stop:418 length:132 start_codon:yes stop_codon:yes gene_type:complete
MNDQIIDSLIGIGMGCAVFICVIIAIKKSIIQVSDEKSNNIIV